MPQVKAISYLCIAVVALLFGVGAFLTARRSPRWLRYAYLFVGAVGGACGALGFALERYRPTLVYSTRAYMDHYCTLLDGIAIGALAVLGIYGLVSRVPKQHDGLTNR